MLAKRIVTGLVLGVAVTAITLLLPTAMAAAAFAVIWLAGAREWGVLASLGTAGCAVYVLAQASLLGALWLLGPGSSAVTLLLAVATFAWLLALPAIGRFPFPVPPLAVAIAGFVALPAAWVALVRIHAEGAAGLALVALAVVWAADVGAFFVGRRFGRRKLAPRVSPGKTWEGVLGGVAAAMIVGAGASFWLETTRALIAVAGLAALVSVIGDLTVSMIKRNLGLKDTGHLLPGHGGVMDRIDGLTSALPLIAIGLQLSGLLD